MESRKSFEARVLARTGRALTDIPRDVPEALLSGQIICRRGDTYVVTSGYPDVDEDGNETWTPKSFRRVCFDEFQASCLEPSVMGRS